MLSFYSLINKLNEFWADYGCVVLLPYTTEVGAGTLTPDTIFNVIGNQFCKRSYVQKVIRPADGRYGDNPNRLYQHHQYQVILKPSPSNIQDLYLKSLESIGIDINKHDIRFIEDDWKNPSIGASGVGWEVCCDGMEISQFTYMQQMGGIELDIITVELAYGLERIALYLQKKNSIYDIIYHNDNGQDILYGDIFKANEFDFSKMALESLDSNIIKKQIDLLDQSIEKLLDDKLPIAALDYCLKFSHHFNLLDAQGVFSAQERGMKLLYIREAVKKCCQLYIELDIRDKCVV